jgi:hypothetical protein
MIMQLSDFKKQPRGPYLFDTWLWDQSIETTIGTLPVELYCDIDTLPSDAMISLANELAVFAETYSTLLLDIIYGHYRCAEARDWLRYWNVPAGLARSEVISQVESIILNVHADLFAGVHIDPHWDPEHKLSLTYAGTITEVNEAPFRLDDGILIRN